ALAEKLQATFATSFDARLLGLSVAAKAGQSENVARALVTWFLEQRSAPERALRMARILADCGAADALRQLADALLESQDGATVHQPHALAGLYYLLADRRREAAAHLERALAMAPARADYAMDLTRTFDRKGVGRAADLWELIARQGLWPRWYCFMMAGET